MTICGICDDKKTFVSLKVHSILYKVFLLSDKNYTC